MLFTFYSVVSLDFNGSPIAGSALQLQPCAVTKENREHLLASNLDPWIASPNHDIFYVCYKPHIFLSQELGTFGHMSAKNFWKMTTGKVLEGVLGNSHPISLYAKYKLISYSRK